MLNGSKCSCCQINFLKTKIPLHLSLKRKDIRTGDVLMEIIVCSSSDTWILLSWHPQYSFPCTRDKHFTCLFGFNNLDPPFHEWTWDKAVYCFSFFFDKNPVSSCTYMPLPWKQIERVSKREGRRSCLPFEYIINYAETKTASSRKYGSIYMLPWHQLLVEWSNKCHWLPLNYEPGPSCHVLVHKSKIRCQ